MESGYWLGLYFVHKSHGIYIQDDFGNAIELRAHMWGSFYHFIKSGNAFDEY